MKLQTAETWAVGAHGASIRFDVTAIGATAPSTVVEILSTGALNVSSASGTAFAVGLTGATNPAFTVDCSTVSLVAGLTVTGAVTGGTVAVVCHDSGAAANLIINALGTGTIGIATISTGLVTIGSTVKVATTLGVGATTPAASGAGISFPSTQSASSDANTLDDYAEGLSTKWLPSLGGNTSYTTQSGSAIKVGRLVYASFSLTVNALGTGSTTTISGLPWTSANNGFETSSGGVGFFTALATNVLYISPQVGVSATTISFISMTAAGTGATNTTAIFGNGARIQGFVVYYANA